MMLLLTRGAAAASLLLLVALQCIAVSSAARPAFNLPTHSLLNIGGGDEQADYDDAQSISDAAKANMKEEQTTTKTTTTEDDPPENDGNDEEKVLVIEDDDEEEEMEEVVVEQDELPGASSTPASEIPRGGSDYASQLEGVKSQVIEKASPSIKELEKAIVEEGSVVAGYGNKADSICNQALQEFISAAPDAGDDATQAVTFDKKLQELEEALDAPLQVLYLKQLALLRESALQGYRSATRTSGSSDYENMLVADGKFARDAQESTREGSDWDYATERTYLQQAMNSIAESSKRSMEIQLKSSQQSQTAMQFLQQQQQMIQQLQMQLYGQSSPWNVGLAYRIPDTNFNLQASYQQGRANIQLSCVPDEYAPMLGPNGFTNGVGPGNLGLSLNLSV